MKPTGLGLNLLARLPHWMLGVALLLALTLLATCEARRAIDRAERRGCETCAQEARKQALERLQRQQSLVDGQARNLASAQASLAATEREIRRTIDEAFRDDDACRLDVGQLRALDEARAALRASLAAGRR